MEYKAAYLVLGIILGGSVYPIMIEAQDYYGKFPPTVAFSKIDPNSTGDVEAISYSDVVTFTGDGSIEISRFVEQAGGWYNTDWDFRKKITIESDKVDNDFINMVILINQTDTDIGSKGRSDARDVLFTSDDAVTKINHDLAKWDDGTEYLQAWVQVPLLEEDTDTIIYMYYGNPIAAVQEDKDNTWLPEYWGVWHFEDDYGLGLTDSSGTGNDILVSEGVECWTDTSLGQGYQQRSFGACAGWSRLSVEDDSPFYNFNATQDEYTVMYLGSEGHSSSGTTQGMMGTKDSGVPDNAIYISSSRPNIYMLNGTADLLRSWSLTNILTGNDYFTQNSYNGTGTLDGSGTILRDGVVTTIAASGANITGIVDDSDGDFRLGHAGGLTRPPYTLNGYMEYQVVTRYMGEDELATLDASYREPLTFYEESAEETNPSIGFVADRVVHFDLNSPNSTRLGGVFSDDCFGSDKVIGIDTVGGIICGSDVGGGAGDNLGDHEATENLNMTAINKIIGSMGCNDTEIIAYNSTTNTWECNVLGSSGGDSLGNHTATQALNMSGNNIIEIGSSDITISNSGIDIQTAQLFGSMGCANTDLISYNSTSDIWKCSPRHIDFFGFWTPSYATNSVHYTSIISNARPTEANGSWECRNGITIIEITANIRTNTKDSDVLVAVRDDGVSVYNMNWLQVKNNTWSSGPIEIDIDADSVCSMQIDTSLATTGNLHLPNVIWWYIHR